MPEEAERLARYALALVIGLIAAATAGCAPYDMPHLKDDELIRVFFANRPEFERLAAELKKDCEKGLVRIDADWTEPRDPGTVGITYSEILHYRDRFASLGITRGYSAVAECSALELIVSAQGLAVSGSSRGYYYSAQAPRNIVASLDTYEPTFKYGAYRRVSDGWYLYYSE